MILKRHSWSLFLFGGVAVAVGCSLDPMGSSGTVDANTGTGGSGPGTGGSGPTTTGKPIDLAQCESYMIPRAKVLRPDGADAPEATETLEQMEIQEKIAMLSGGLSCEGKWETCDFDGTGVPSLGIKDFKMRDGPRGVHTHDGTKATSFAVAMARAASFDTELEYRVGEVQGKEMVALQYDLALAPTINTLRHPGWARSQETYGEDPVHQGEMGAAFTNGVQKHVPACPKHFSNNDTDENRGTVNVNVDQQTLRENYTLPFYITIEKSDPACIMAAYNGVNGDTMTENQPLLTDILRTEWGWEGFVVSDWWATKKNGPKSLNAGLDLEMPDNLAFKDLPAGVQSGEVSAARIDEAALRILNARARWGQLSSTHNSGAANPGIVNDPTHKAVARETAEKGAVLLENKGILPIKPEVKSIIVMGPDADLPIDNTDERGFVHGMGDRGSSNTNPPYAISYLDGITARATGITVTSGMQASEAAGKDLVVIPVTMQHEDEGEAFGGGGDRDDLTFSGSHPIHWTSNWDPNVVINNVKGAWVKDPARKSPAAYIEEVLAVNQNVVVLIAMGGAVVMDSWADKVGAIVQTFYPGQEAGNAVAALLFGDVNFSGKLPFTVAKNAGDYPTFGNLADSITADYLHGYRKFEAEGLSPRYWYGYGLSYTTFTYSELEDTCTAGGKAVTSAGAVLARIKVTNSGTVPGAEVVQAYVGYPNTTARRPKKELKAFKRTKVLMPGESEVVEFRIPTRDIAYWSDAGWKVETGVVHDLIIAASSNPAETNKFSFPFTPN